MPGEQLKNEDFRKLLQAPRASISRQQHYTDNRNNGGVAKKSKRPKSTPEDDGKYLNRSELRRKGKNQESGEQGEILHGIRGLDFELLSKVRGERQKRDSQHGRVESQHGRVESQHGRDIKPRSVSKVADDLFELSKAARSSSSRVARAIDAILMGISRAHRSDRKVSLGSISYVFAQNNRDAFEIPTARKKPSLPGPKDTGSKRFLMETLVLPKDLVGEISNIIEYCGKRATTTTTTTLIDKAFAKEDRLDRASERTSDDEDDIFGDAGTDYVPTNAAAETDQARKGSTYFNQYSESGVGALDEEQAQHGLKVSLGMHNVPNLNAAREYGQKIDAYDECYPLYFDTGGNISDEDEEHRGMKEINNTSLNKKAVNKREQAKLDGELQKIQKIFDEKGYKHLKPQAPELPKKKRRI